MNKNGVPSPFVGQQVIDEPVMTDDGYGRFSAHEVKLLRVFKDKTILDLLLLIMQQSVLSEDQIKTAKDIFVGKQDLYNAINKVFRPEKESNSIIVGARWLDKKFADVSLDDIKSVFLARKDSIKFFDNALDRLKMIVDESDFSPLPLVVDLGLEKDYENLSSEEIKRATVGFQDTMIYISNYFNLIETLSKMREETPEERKARLSKDSVR